MLRKNQVVASLFMPLSVLLLAAVLPVASGSTSTSAPSQLVRPLPPVVRDGQTLSLLCGQVYSGTLDLRGRRNITVRTEGECGNAMITPAQPVRGWTRDGRLWWAALDNAPQLVRLGERFLSLAHHPNTPSEWLSGTGRGKDALQLQVNLPGRDLTGAVLVWQPEDWLILRQPIERDDQGLLHLSGSPEPGFGFRERTPFYLEGQRWMLDSPGEWLHEHGRLYLWPADGRSPEGRVWAAPQATAIDARASRDVRIVNLTIFLAARGIDGSDSRALSIDRVEILDSGDEAVRLGGEGARLAHVRVSGTRQHGVRAEDDTRDVEITNSVIEGAGMLGMPLRSKGAIVFEQSSGHRILRNRVTDTAYIGIRVFRDTLVADNVITRACQRMTDCGGIYTFARDRQPLRTRIERNRISGLRGRLSHAIYLDDFANEVVVRDNQLTGNPGGMQLHDAFNNLITGNRFSRHTHEHLLFNETAASASIIGNVVRNNRFSLSGSAPVYRLWSHHGGATLSRFALYGRNRYQGTRDLRDERFAELEGQVGISAVRWAPLMDEVDAVYAMPSAPAVLPPLARQPQQK